MGADGKNTLSLIITADSKAAISNIKDLAVAVKDLGTITKAEERAATITAAEQVKRDEIKKKSAISVGAVRKRVAAETSAAVAVSQAKETEAVAKATKAQNAAAASAVQLGRVKQTTEEASAAAAERAAAREKKAREDAAAYEYKTGKKSYSDYIAFLKAEEAAETASNARRRRLVTARQTVDSSIAAGKRAASALAQQQAQEVMRARRNQDLIARYRYEKREIDLRQYKTYLKAEEGAEKQSIERRLSLIQEQDRLRRRPVTEKWGIQPLADRVGILADGAQGLSQGAQSLGQYIGLVDELTKKGASLVEMQNKVARVFGDSSKQIDDWSKDAPKRLALAPVDALRYASQFGLLLKGQGVGKNDAERAATSQRLVGLAADITSFNHVAGGVPLVLEKINSGLIGQIRPLRDVGVFLTQDAIKAQAYADGIAKPVKNVGLIHRAYETVNTAVAHYHDQVAKYGKGSEEASRAITTVENAQARLSKAMAGTNTHLTQAQKSQATLNLIFKQTAIQQGDLARTAKSAANAQRILTAEEEAFFTTLGTKLLPLRKQVIGLLSDMVDKFTAVDAATHGASTSILAWGLVVGPLAGFVGNIVLQVMRMRTAWLELKEAEEGAAAAGAMAGGSSGLGKLGGSIAGGFIANGVRTGIGAVGGALVSTAPITLPLALAAGLAYNVEQGSIADSDQQMALLSLPARQRQQYLQGQRTKMALSFGSKIDPDEAGGMGPSGRAATPITPEQQALLASMDREIALTKVSADRVDAENARRVKAQKALQAKSAAAASGKGSSTGIAAGATGTGGGLYSGAARNAAAKKNAKDDKEAEDDALQARETIAGGKKEDIEALKSRLEEKFKDGKGPDSLLKQIDDLAAKLKSVNIDIAKTAHTSAVNDDPTNHKNADALYQQAVKNASGDLEKYQMTLRPQLSEERNKKLDEALSKKIEGRLHDYEQYGPNASPTQRKAVLDQVAAMRKQLRTTEAQTEAEAKTTAARKSVDDKLIESTKKAAEIVDQTNEVRAQMASAQHEADIALLNGQLEETKELPARLALRQQILAAENAKIDSEKDAKDAAVAKEAATMYDKNGALTHDQAALLDAKYDANGAEADDAKSKVRRSFTAGSDEDKRNSAGSLASYYRDLADNGGSYDDLLKAHAKEKESAGTQAPAVAAVLAAKQQREQDAFLQKSAQTGGMGELGKMALGQKGGSYFDAFRQLDNSQALAPASEKAGLISEQASSLTDMATADGSQLDKRVILGRLRDLKASAEALGDVKLKVEIDADEDKIKSSLGKIFMDIAKEWGDEAAQVFSDESSKLSSKFFSDMFTGANRGKFTDAKGHRISYGRAFGNEAKSDLEGSAGQIVGKGANDFMKQRFHEIQTDLNPVFSRWADEFKNSLKSGGASAAANILEGAAAIASAASAIGAASGAHGKKRKWGGLIGEVVGGIAGSFIGGPGGGWKAGSAIGGSIGGMLGFAVGGQPPIGRTSIVGDPPSRRGTVVGGSIVPAFAPELILPKSPVNVLNKTQVNSVMQAMGAVPGSALGGGSGTQISVTHIGDNHEASDQESMFRGFTNNIVDFMGRR